MQLSTLTLKKIVEIEKLNSSQFDILVTDLQGEEFKIFRVTEHV